MSIQVFDVCKCVSHFYGRGIFINIFGGITKCDEIARGIVDIAPPIPISVRMMGTNEEEGKKILIDNGYRVYENMEDSAKNAVDQARASREVE